MLNIIGNIKINGVYISYYFICRRKLWLFARNIKLEDEHQNVHIGKQIHEERYSRYKKDRTILDTINIDFIKKGESLVLHEIKKSKSLERAHEYQLYFYLDFLSRYGLEAKGVINYPLINKKISLELNDDMKKELKVIYGEIEQIITGKLPPVKRKNYCTKCAYYEFCFGE